MRTWLCLFVAICGANAFAKPEFWDTFQKNYPIAPDSAIAKASCQTCHAGPPMRNVFGKAVEAELDKEDVTAVSPTILTALESADSDGDGASNGDEIRAGTLPGDAASLPPAQGEPAQAPTPVEKPLIPNHSFHPIVVHFPIALILIGALLEVYGKWKKKPEYRRAGQINVSLGAVSTLVVVPTGIAAFLRMGFVLEGTVLVHAALAVVGSLLALATVALRPKLDGKNGYWVLLGTSATIIGLVGHLGGVLVHGW